MPPGGAQPDGSQLVAGLGLVFVISGVSIWFTWILPTTITTYEALYEFVMHVLFGLIILALGVHIERSELTPTERQAVVIWCFAGFMFLFALATWSQLTDLLTREITRDFVSTVVVFGGIGGAFGAFTGINYGRATRNRQLAEHNNAQRETLILLTRLLRHDIRNDMTIINGHASLLEDHVDPEGEDSLDLIRRRSDAVARLLKDTDTLVDTLDADRTFEPIDVTAVIADELDRIRTAYPAVEIQTDIPTEMAVLADGLLRQLFLNLFQNAVNHNDPESLTIGVDAQKRTDGRVDISVWDTGEGMPASIEATCFELGQQGPESSGDGLGLYLVSRLVEIYGGQIELTNSAAGGTRFIITLEAPDTDGNLSVSDSVAQSGPSSATYGS